MFVFEPLKLMLIILFSSLVPGIPFVAWFLRKSALAWYEKLSFGFVAGIVLVPLLLLLEGMVGIPFSFPLVLADVLILFAAGIALCIKDGMLALPALSLPSLSTKDELLDGAKKFLPAIFLFLIMFLAFWLRMQSFSPIYSELDPYFYMYGGSQILTEGFVPITDDTAWFDKQASDFAVSHRANPLGIYLEAQWYSIYTQGGEYERYLFSTIANFYPPLVSAFMCLGAYLLLSSLFGRRHGLLAAGLFAFTPALLLKMQAGVAEGQPYGFFALLFYFGAYAASLKYRDVRLACFAALAFFAAIAGSSSSGVAVLVTAGFVSLEAIRLFWAHKHVLSHGHHEENPIETAKHILTKEARNYAEFFMQANLIVLAGVLAANLLMGLYSLQGLHELAGMLVGRIGINSLLIMGGPIAFAFILYASGRRFATSTQRLAAIGALFAASLLLLISPLGNVVDSYIGNYAGAATYPSPLERTISEQGQSGASFESQLGFIGRTLTEGDVGIMPNTVQGIVGWLFVAALSLIAAPLSIFANVLFALIDFAINLLFGFGMQTGEKTPSLMLVALSLAFAYGAVSYAILLVKKDEKYQEGHNIACLFLLLGLIVFPIAYMGLNKIKFLVYLGMISAIAAVVSAALIEKLAFLAISLSKKYSANARTIAYALSIVLIFSTIALEFLDERSAVAQPLLVASFSERYQQDPLGSGMLKMQRLCEQIGGADAQICAAGSDANFASSMENQFDSRLCIYSQLSNLTNPSRDQLLGAQLRCQVISPYWINSMEWIRSSTENGSRITSWWDYGHWINFFGERNAVLRNEHARKDMIGEIAHAYIDGTPQDLAAAMGRFDSKYALFDSELISGGSVFGGKYGALNYLSCARDNLTSVSVWPGGSQCEFEHMFEVIYVPNANKETCIVSPSQQISGTVGYVEEYAGQSRTLKRQYCMANMRLADGRSGLGTYYLGRKDADGNLLLNKAFVQQYSQETDYTTFFTIYNLDKVWQGANGTLVDGYEDRKGKFYDSNLYRAFVLGDLPGFTLAYQTPGNAVKIYEWLGYTPYKQAS
ncbi:hypothetical protein J4441_02045 [Candidatus Micrarchaeota archaeon]|nr:hypothetical protein [Candidatus Micrarchaeota archaeon]